MRRGLPPARVVCFTTRSTTSRRSRSWQIFPSCREPGARIYSSRLLGRRVGQGRNAAAGRPKHSGGPALASLAGPTLLLVPPYFFSSIGAGKTSALLDRFHSRTPAPCVPTASCKPSGEKATHQQVLPCGPSDAVSFFSFTSHRRAVRSWLAEASVLPSAANAMSLTQSLCPSSVASSLPSAFQSLILRSAPHVAS